MHRFFIDPDHLTGRHVYFDADQAHQLRRVLRLRPGDRVLVLDGRQWQYDVTLEEVSNARAVGLLGERTAAGGEPAVRLTLYQSLLRREKFEWVLQKGTELGVAAFVPVITRRSLLRDADDVTPEKLARWRRIIKEAAEQSGRGLLPDLSPPVPFAAALDDAVRPALIAWEEERDMNLRAALRPHEGTTEVALFVGPEGGFEPEEIAAARQAGVLSVTLGRRVLRTETAAVVGAALVLYELGEMG
jgi:16S rRNA (uracil1498-N3)-methyltransferase